MPGSHRVECEVDVDPAEALGAYANAFRVLEDDEGCLLEFLVYSQAEDKASVVRRVRVRKEFLPAIRARIDQALGAARSLDVQDLLCLTTLPLGVSDPKP